MAFFQEQKKVTKTKGHRGRVDVIWLFHLGMLPILRFVVTTYFWEREALVKPVD
jgi:hypothetical protein